jgi:hypothetical protein
MSFRHRRGGDEEKVRLGEDDVAIRRERGTRVPLDGMSEEQIEVVRDGIIGALIGQAEDLSLLNKNRDPKRAIREVAALGRLAYWLGIGEVHVPDRIARALVARKAKELVEMDVDLLERYEEAVVEHQAWRVFVEHFSSARGDVG